MNNTFQVAKIRIEYQEAENARIQFRDEVFSFVCSFVDKF